METGNNVKPQQGINTPSATPNANAATDSTAAINASPNAPTITPNDVLAAEVKEDFAKYLITVEVAIRRRPGMVGLPGADPAERVYRIGSSLDARSRGALKGISGELKFLLCLVLLMLVITLLNLKKQLMNIGLSLDFLFLLMKNFFLNIKWEFLLRFNFM